MKLLILIALILSCSIAYTQIDLTTSVNHSHDFPFEIGMESNYFQSIYNKDEIKGAGNITGIKLYVTEGFSLGGNDDFEVYLGETSSNNFQNIGLIDTALLELVSDTTVQITKVWGADYIQIDFPVPFSYSGNSNLVVGIKEKGNGKYYGDYHEGFYWSYRNGATRRSWSVNGDIDLSLQGPNSKVDKLLQLTLLGISQSCPKPKNVSPVGITQTDLFLTWDDPISSGDYQIKYGLVNFMNSGSGTDLTSSTDSALILGLTSATHYESYIRNVCGVGDTSAWVGPVYFITECATQPTPFIEDFDGNASCWHYRKGILDTNSRLEFINQTGINLFGGQSGFNQYQTNFREWIVSPSIQVSASNMQVNFDLKNEYVWDGKYYSSAWADDDTLNFVISYDNGETWDKSNILAQWSINHLPADSYENVSIPIPSTNGPVKFGFYNINTIANSYSFIGIDNFKIEQIPSCKRPNRLHVKYADDENIFLEWEDTISNQWEVAYGLDGFSIGTGQDTTISSKELQITNLLPDETYDIYIRTKCGSINSPWYGALPVHTECASDTVNYTFNHDCWTTGIGVLTDSTQMIAKSSNWDMNVSGSSMDLRYFAVSDWLISPSISLSGNGDYLKCKVRNVDYNINQYYGWGIDDTVAIVISTDNGITWDINNALEIYTYSNRPNLSDFYQMYDLSSYTGKIKIGFYVSSKNKDGGMKIFIENFYLGQVPSCSAPSNFTLANIQGNSVDVFVDHILPVQGYEVSIVNAGSQPNASNVVYSAIDSIHVSGLSPNTNYHVYVRNVCSSSDVSMWQGSLFFKTPCGIEPVPYQEYFSSNWPSCWTEGQGVLSDSTVFTSTFSFWDDIYWGSFLGYSLWVNDFGVNTENWLFTPSFDLTGGDYFMEINMVAKSSTQGSFYTWGPDDSLTLLISLDNGLTWSNSNILEVWTDSSGVNSNMQVFSVDLSPYTGVVKFAFRASSTTDDGNLGIVISGINIKEKPDIEAYFAPEIANDVICGPDSRHIDSLFYIINNSYTSGVVVPYEFKVGSQVLKSSSLWVGPLDTARVLVDNIGSSGQHNIEGSVLFSMDANMNNNTASVYQTISTWAYDSTQHNISCYGENDGFLAINFYGMLGNYTYHWVSNVSNPASNVITNITAGVYTISYQDQFGCKDLISFNVTQPDELEVDLQDNYNGTVTANVSGGTPPYQYNWFGLGIGQTSLPSVGLQKVMISDANGCTVEDTIHAIASVDDEVLSFLVDVYPNPVAKNLFIQFNSSVKDFTHIVLYDVKGSEAEIPNFENIGDKVVLDLSSIPVGVYTLRIEIEQGVVYKKVVIVN